MMSAISRGVGGEPEESGRGGGEPEGWSRLLLKEERQRGGA